MRVGEHLEIIFDKIVGGGQALGTAEDGRKVFAWGVLPKEKAKITITKKKSKFLEGVVHEVIDTNKQRIKPKDPQSYLSTSPWQIMAFDYEQFFKAALIEEAFELHDMVLPEKIEVYSDGIEYGYRNKVEFSFYGDTTPSGETLDLAFFKRGSKGKIKVDGTSLANSAINDLACQIRDLLSGANISARQLKTLLIRCNQQSETVWQLYIKDKSILDALRQIDFRQTAAKGGEVIYSDPKSPASRITERLYKYGQIVLSDTIRGVKFNYATEGFFQINLPVYQTALSDMKYWVNDASQNFPELKRTLDLYSGVGSIGLTIGGDQTILVESNPDAVREMRANIKDLKSSAEAVLAPSEKALDYVTNDSLVIVDPPRAGLHQDVINKLLEEKPPRIIYLSCNPVTQARDTALLAEKYGIRYHRGYNFFPRTPHIENLIVLDLMPKQR